MKTQNNTAITFDIQIVDIDTLIPHEDYIPGYLDDLTESIRKDQSIKRPIVVDHKTNVIIDGHHRYYALKQLGYGKIPCIFVDYLEDSDIQVNPRRNLDITKNYVLKYALSGKTFPYKTTKHMLSFQGRKIALEDIPIEKNIGLAELL